MRTAGNPSDQSQRPYPEITGKKLAGLTKHVFENKTIVRWKNIEAQW